MSNRQALVLLEDKVTCTKHFKVLSSFDKLDFSKYRRFSIIFLPTSSNHTDMSIPVTFRSLNLAVDKAFNLLDEATWFINSTPEQICDICKESSQDISEVQIESKSYKFCQMCVPTTAHEYEIYALDSKSSRELDELELSIEFDLELLESKLERVRDIKYSNLKIKNWTMFKLRKKTKSGKEYFTWQLRHGDKRITVGTNPRRVYQIETNSSNLEA